MDAPLGLDAVLMLPLQMRNNTSPPQRPPPDMSLYPWAQRTLTFPAANNNIFPRYGAAINAVASPKGEIYMMGGLINGSMVKGDLWTIEATSSIVTCNPVPTMAEGPGPRVGHAALLVGNAFIVFGGDTKVDELDVLDDTLYLLNTCKSRRLKQSWRLGLTVSPTSHQTLVTRPSCRATACWPIWTHLEHLGLKNLHLWWSGRRLLL